MKPYFDCETAKARLRSEFRQREGSPFSKGGVGGLDCLTFAAGCMFSSGAVTRFDLPTEYSMSGEGSEMLRLIRGAISGLPNVRCVWEAGAAVPPESVIRFGDVLIVTAKVMNHFAIAGDLPEVWDCFPGRGVSKGNLYSGKLLRRLNSVWRAYGQSTILNGGGVGSA